MIFQHLIASRTSTVGGRSRSSLTLPLGSFSKCHDRSSYFNNKFRLPCELKNDFNSIFQANYYYDVLYVITQHLQSLLKFAHNMYRMI